MKKEYNFKKMKSKKNSYTKKLPNIKDVKLPKNLGKVNGEKV